MSSWSFASGVPASTASAPELGLLPGARLGGWTVLGPLGEGGASRVYRARGPAGELAALKVLRARLAPAARERFRREGALAHALRQEGIVPLLDAGEAEGVPFLVYALVEGGPPFLDLLAAADLPGRVRLVRDVARAVGGAHRAGVVHRDLKPGNLLVDAQRRPHVTDFGLALAPGLPRLTAAGEVLGTPLYMAPEQTDPDPAGNVAVGPPADVWSLGVLLYLALTGRHPFPAGSWLELRRALSAPPAAPRAVWAESPPALEAVCLRALALDPAARYPDGAALAAALDAALADGVAGPGAPLPIAAAPTVGDAGRLGRYRLLGEVGRGGMGVVFRAQAPDGAVVALKRLRLTGTDLERQRERFRREVQAMLRTEHRNVVRLLDAGEEDGQPFLVMEWVEGEDLGTWLLREGPVEPREGAALVARLARALAHCHERGVLHRDLKPQNVLLRARDGEPLLTDFGLARAQDADGALTRSGQFLGTLGYCPPEQARGDLRAIDERSDVWGLGGILFALLTGRPPLQGATLAAVVGADGRGPPRPGEVREGIPPALDALCARCLAQDPARRLPSAAALAAALEGWLAIGLGAGGRARLLGLVSLAGVLLALLGAAGLLAGPRGPSAAPPPPAPPSRAAQVAALLSAAAGRAQVRDAPGELELLDRALALDPDHVPALVRRGRLRSSGARHDLEGARRDADRALTLAPRSAEAHALCSWLLGIDGKVEESARESRLALELDPACVSAHVQLGRALQWEGDVDGAERSYARALELAPDFARAIAGRAWVHSERGDLTAARADFDRAAELAEDDPSIFFLRAVFRGNHGDPQGELEDLERALAIDPNFAFALGNRGRLRERAGDLEGALQDYARAAELAPQSYELQTNLGAAWRTRGRPDLALVAFDRAVALRPDHPHPRRLRAELREHLGDLEGALRDVEQLLERTPEHPWALRARMRLMRAIPPRPR